MDVDTVLVGKLRVCYSQLKWGVNVSVAHFPGYSIAMSFLKYIYIHGLEPMIMRRHCSAFSFFS